MEVRPIRVVQYGLGATGKAIARVVARTPGLLLVGGIDHDPALLGRDVGSVIELGRELGCQIAAEPNSVLNAAHPDIVIVATRPSLSEAYTQIAACLRARVNVLSTCEELIYPRARYPELSNNLNQLARQGGASVLGIGVNPGFIQDLLPLILTGPCINVERISATRVFDASLRRATLHERIGAGTVPSDFERRVEDGHLPHTGLNESVQLIAHSIGWQLDRVEERVTSILTDEWVHQEYVNVAPGQVIGARQTATGYVHGHDVIVLTWQVSVGAPESYDEIIIDGKPPIRMRIDGGIHGGEAAPALVVHAIAPTVAATPGLHTVLDLPPLHYRLPIYSQRD